MLNVSQAVILVSNRLLSRISGGIKLRNNMIGIIGQKNMKKIISIIGNIIG